MQVEQWPIDKLIPFHNNSRVHDEKNLKAISASVDRFSWLQPIVVDKEGVIIMGHGRREAALQLGMTEVPVLVADWLTENEAAAAREADNMTQDLSFFDMELLNANLGEIDWLDIDMTEFGFKLDDELFGEAEEDDYTEEDAQEAPSRAQRGDIWQLGEHRLMCGDSTSETDVQSLMGGGNIKADMVFTDPPYGVEYTGGIQFKGGKVEKNNRDMILNDDADIYESVFSMLEKFTDSACYVWFADSNMEKVSSAASRHGDIHSLIIWVKNGGYGALNANYKQKHEPCLYWKPKGGKLNFVGATTETTVWEIEKDGVNEFHPTQKPIALASKAIRNHKADTVLDLFGGSGSTLIACEQLGRKCYMMELDPHYCDVIIDRWESLTGKEARKLG